MSTGDEFYKTDFMIHCPMKQSSAPLHLSVETPFIRVYKRAQSHHCLNYRKSKFRTSVLDNFHIIHGWLETSINNPENTSQIFCGSASMMFRFIRKLTFVDLDNNSRIINLYKVFSQIKAKKISQASEGKNNSIVTEPSLQLDCLFEYFLARRYMSCNHLDRGTLELAKKLPLLIEIYFFVFWQNFFLLFHAQLLLDFGNDVQSQIYRQFWIS